MTINQTLLEPLLRPGLLVRAARHGLGDYDRDRHLRRILRIDSLPAPAAATRQLLELERGHEERRVAGDAAYSVQRHIEALCALMAETRLAGVMRAPGAAATKLSLRHAG